MEELDHEPSAGAAEVETEPGGTPVVRLTGEIDISNIDSIRAEVERVVEPRPALVIFDLSELAFMDSSGIALLLQAAGRCGAVQLRHPSDLVRRVLEVTGLSDVLPVVS